MVPPGQWFTRKPLLALKIFTGYVHRSTLPQSRIRSTAPSGREPGWVRTIHRAAQKPQRCGRFSSPLRKLKNRFPLPFIGVHSLSLAFARQLPQRGSRGGAVPFNVPLGKRKVSGDFHRPYEGLRHSSGGAKAQQNPPGECPGGWEYYQSVT